MTTTATEPTAPPERPTDTGNPDRLFRVTDATGARAEWGFLADDGGDDAEHYHVAFSYRLPGESSDVALALAPGGIGWDEPERPLRFRRRVDAVRYLEAFGKPQGAVGSAGETYRFFSPGMLFGPEPGDFEALRFLAHIIRCDAPDEPSRIVVLPGREVPA